MTCYEYFDQPPDDVRAATQIWLGAHGIDPDRVVIPGWIEPRPGPRQIAYLCIDLEAPPEHMHLVEVLQLESPPMPLPPEFTRWAWQALGALNPGAVTPP